jgi:fructose-1,6-bisphosphatase/inositol monophosphatase family enzyme
LAGSFSNEGTYVANPQTAADRGVEDLILSSLRAAFPGLAIIGEESSEGHDVDGVLRSVYDY